MYKLEGKHHSNGNSNNGKKNIYVMDERIFVITKIFIRVLMILKSFKILKLNNLKFSLIKYLKDNFK